VVFRPWFDAVAVRVVTRCYFPASRGWAAAWAADGDLERFREEAGAGLPDVVARRAAARIARSSKAYESEAARWEAVLFGPLSPSPDRLIAAERARNRAAFRFMRGRSAFLPWLKRLPPVRWTITPAEEVEARHGSRLATPEAAYPPPAQPQIDTSHAVAGDGRRTYWVRFPSPVLGDTAWSKVIEPVGIDNPPTLIFLHGIGVELEMWPPTADPLDDLVKHGVRIVRPTAPWHAQRMQKGFYGGEPIMARGPDGLLTCFQAWVSEVAILVDWVSRLGSPRVAVGGVSLGALTSQLIATASREWPASLRPSSLFLVTTTGSMLDVLDGSLCRGAGFSDELNRSGWREDDLKTWLPLLQPNQPPVMAPGRIVVILGKVDDVMPYTGGRALVDRWRLPQENVFVRPQGHFSVPLGLLAETEPIQRLLTVLIE
jgi:pimeloyl-ACP methyl ester carboxylesterase